MIPWVVFNSLNVVFLGYQNARYFTVYHSKTGKGQQRSTLIFNYFDHDLKAVGLKSHRCENLFEMFGFAH